MNDLISVIVPVYKVEDYLDKCIDSIVNQTYRDLEIILVDDGSPDNCPAMCDAWAEKDSRIKVIHKENGGLSDARNTGLRMAHGDYIAFVDSDDWLKKDMYETLSKVICTNHCDIAICNLQYVYDDSDNNPENNSGHTHVYNTQDALSALIDDKIRQVVWNKLYKKEVLKDILFPVGKYHEDEFWSYQVIGNADKVVTVDYIGYYYRQRSNSIMGNSYSLKRLDAIEAKCQRQNYLDTNYPELSSKGRINLIFTCMYHGQLALRFLNTNEKETAFITLNTVKNNYKITIQDKTNMTLTNRIWNLFSSISLSFTCKFRNILHIGT